MKDPLATAVIITGVSRGLGRAIAGKLVQSEKFHILGIGRNDFLKANEKDSQRYRFLNLDLSDVSAVLSHVPQIAKFTVPYGVVVFISNAGNIEPLGNVGDVLPEKIIESINVNALAPHLIINALLEATQEKSVRLINISTGAAKRPIHGWASYCASKAYAEMFFRTIELQQANRDLSVVTIDPGALDTDMQDQIRRMSPDACKDVDYFQNLKTSGRLIPVDQAADRVISLLEKL